jgi:hypothetical protein
MSQLPAEALSFPHLICRHAVVRGYPAANRTLQKAASNQSEKHRACRGLNPEPIRSQRDHREIKENIMKVFNTKKRIAAAALAGLAVVGSGMGALAYWTSTGEGSGTGATTAGTSNLSYAQDALSDMYPGDSAQDLIVTVTNDNPVVGGESQYVSNVEAYVTTDKDGCTGSDFLINGLPAPSAAEDAVSLTWTPVDLAAGDSAATAGDTIQFNNTAANQDACKSAVVTIHYATV